MRTSCRLAALAALFAGIAASQSFTGTILGTVQDSSGAVVPGVKVEVINAGTNVRAEAVTDASGNYTAPLLQPGQYRVEVSAGGFKKFSREGIILQVQQQARVDVVLSVGALTESVVVTADASMARPRPITPCR